MFSFEYVERGINGLQQFENLAHLLLQKVEHRVPVVGLFEQLSFGELERVLVDRTGAHLEMHRRIDDDQVGAPVEDGDFGRLAEIAATKDIRAVTFVART